MTGESLGAIRRRERQERLIKRDRWEAERWVPVDMKSRVVQIRSPPDVPRMGVWSTGRTSRGSMRGAKAGRYTRKRKLERKAIVEAQVRS